jgi:tRNA A37 threonylcarbamoyladenosine dehydratase
MEEPARHRFGGTARLYGADSLARFASARVMVIGLGGVGSWTVEALARSGIGHLVLVDMDDVCVTNTNRQLPAATSTIGHPKAMVLHQRVADIAPDCLVEAVLEFFTASNAEALLDRAAADIIVDATDNARTKATIIDRCTRRKRAVVTAGAAGGKKDATRIRTGDLGSTGGDNLLRQTRRELRRNYGWPSGENITFGVSAVYSPEPVILPDMNDSCDPIPLQPGVRLDCAGGLGAVCHVTGTFGFALAGEVLRLLEATTPPLLLAESTTANP